MLADLANDIYLCKNELTSGKNGQNVMKNPLRRCAVNTELGRCQTYTTNQLAGWFCGWWAHVFLGHRDGTAWADAVRSRPGHWCEYGGRSELYQWVCGCIGFLLIWLYAITVQCTNHSISESTGDLFFIHCVSISRTNDQIEILTSLFTR